MLFLEFVFIRTDKQLQEKTFCCVCFFFRCYFFRTPKISARAVLLIVLSNEKKNYTKKSMNEWVSLNLANDDGQRNSFPAQNSCTRTKCHEKITQTHKCTKREIKSLERFGNNFPIFMCTQRTFFGTISFARHSHHITTTKTLPHQISSVKWVLSYERVHETNENTEAANVR